MEEKRQFKRFHKEVKIHFNVITAMGISDKIPQDGESVSIDISKGGVLFVSKQAIPISSSIECEFYLPGSKEPIYAKARVVRIEEFPQYHQYDIGIQFIAISKDDEKVLFNYLLD